jgi:hypothetical protein
MAASAAAADYGAVERMGEAGVATLRQQGRRTMPKFIAPVLVLIVAGCACVLVSALYRADSQMSQVREGLQAVASWRLLACDDVCPYVLPVRAGGAARRSCRWLTA